MSVDTKTRGQKVLKGNKNKSTSKLPPILQGESQEMSDLAKYNNINRISSVKQLLSLSNKNSETK